MNPGQDAKEMQGQAEHWFFRLLEPDCTAAEREACRRWRVERPAHDAAWQEVEHLWQESGALGADPAIAMALRQAQRDRVRPAGLRWAWPLAALASAALVLVAVMGPGRWWGVETTPPGTRYATALGEQRTVALSDGSTLVLDTATVLLERYTHGRRRIDLQQGQADFQVRGDAQRPFVVHAAGGVVTAVGTRFQVRVEGRAAAVVLLEGVVQVDSPDEGDARRRATLMPGQRLRFDGSRWDTDAIDQEVARGWTEGNLFARNWRLADLLEEMNRYSGTPLRLADPALGDLPISGTFRAGDHASLVLALQHGWSLRARPVEGGEILLERASPAPR